MKKLTNIEKIVRDILISLNLSYKREFRIGNYPVDFYLEEYKLSIQCDGCFHHNCHKCSTNKKNRVYSRQLFQEFRDNACLAYHMYSKISLLRLKECDILDNQIKVIKQIKNTIKKIKNGEIVYDK